MTLTLLCHVQALNVATVIRQKGWCIKQGWVLPGHLAQADAWRKEIVIPFDFEQRLLCPNLSREVAHWCFAHELAHIVLHLDKICRGVRTEAMEQAAANWAIEFLLPEGQLRDHPDIRGMAAAMNEGQRWARLARAAEWFQVPTAAVESALIRYGLAQGPVYVVRDLLAA